MSNKKQPNKKENKNKNNAKSQKSPIPLGKICFLLISTTIGFASYYAYSVLFTPPPLPQIDLNRWWGLYPVNPKPDTSIRPYKIEFTDVVINDLKERLLHRRPFAPPLEQAGFSYGFNTDFLTRVLDYWKNSYNFKEREAFLNKYEHFVTNVQGLDVHFMRVQPKVDAGVVVVPILMLHGWPGSIREFYEIIPKLTSPRPGHTFVFEVIAPSLPGYGFSQPAVRPGLNALEIAVMMHNLMKRIGHNHYYVQGGDWGHAIGGNMATLFPGNVLGFHTNCPMVLHPLHAAYLAIGSIFPSLVVEPELTNRMYPALEHLQWTLRETGYAHLQATKPDTVGAALTDSPAGLAAYILEKFSTWTNRAYVKANDGNLLSKYTLTHLLDNIMIYWSTNSITSSMRLYAETMNRKYTELKMDQIPTEVPTWGIKFKHELLFQPDVVLKLKYKNYLHSTIVDGGGHFAALENPDVMADDIFEAVDTFMQFTGGNKQTMETSNSKVPTTIYDFTVKDINGKDVKLDKYKGHVTIIVNVASQCGYTNVHYKQLNELYEKYGASRGLRILAFPCNQFGGQEPGSPREILQFAKERGVKFDLFEKVDVNGENAHPLWTFLKGHQGGTLGDFIKWNFSKFIVDKNGVPVERFGPNTNPLELESYLAKYW